MATLTLKNISKQYKNDDHATLRSIDLTVTDDDFLVLLGPSGCGKTTLLRMIAGLIAPTEGEIGIGDRNITDLPPQNRGIGMVFQNYALYPHMSIKKNLTFALEIARMKKEQREKEVERVSCILNIQNHLTKKPHMLSGGERQRVAMGRAMVMESQLYLFDEPLSNLDEELRTKLRPEILHLFHQLHVPFVYVTHDQVDAMTMGTKIAVMNQGEIQQLASPEEIYHHPANMFVAEFVGSPKMNFIPVTAAISGDQKALVRYGEEELSLPQYNEILLADKQKDCILGIRPEDIHFTPVSEHMHSICCTLTRYEHLRSQILLYADFQGISLCISAPIHVRAKVGEKMTVYLDKQKVHLFDAETQVHL